MENDEHKELEVVGPSGLRFKNTAWLVLDEKLVTEVGKLIEENKKLKEETCAWALAVRWAIECGLTLDQVVADEDMDDFFQEMDEKDIDYLYGFLEYAKKCIKEGKA